MRGQRWLALDQISEVGVDIQLPGLHGGQRLARGAHLRGGVGAEALARRAVEGQHPAAHRLRSQQLHVQPLALAVGFAPGLGALVDEHLHGGADAHQALRVGVPDGMKRASPLRQASAASGRPAS